MSTTEEKSNPINTGEVPKVTFKLLTGSKEEGGRPAGVFTADDLINILLYVRHARGLPSDLPTFIKELGSDNTGIAGLEPDDILTLYKLVTNHANRWTPVESLVKDQSANLTVVSLQIVTVGDNIIKTIDRMDIIDQMAELGGSTVPITTDRDKKIQEALPVLIKKLKAICEEELIKTRVVLDAVRDYRTEISGGTLSDNRMVSGLEPAVADKKERAKKANLSTRIETLQTEIDTLDAEIEQLKKDYDKFVGLAFTGAVGGPIGLAITGGIFGAKAEEARKNKNKKIEEKEEKSRLLATDQMIQGALNIFATQFTDLGMRLLDAEQALNHLEFLWKDILARVNSSVETWSRVKDSDMLMSFVTDMQLIVNPWKEVGDMTAQLAKVFDQAYDQFRKTYGAINQ